MPRQVDHAARRRRIAEAVCLLIDRHGLEGVTLRDVAVRAEVSMGAVQRCFRTKDEMLLFALGHVGARIAERVRTRLGVSPAQSAATALGHAAAEVALTADGDRTEARVWLAFVARAAVDESLAAALRSGCTALEDLFARLVAEAAGSGAAEVADGGPDGPTGEESVARREARTLIALADGLTCQVLIGHLTAARAEEVLHGHLVALWERLGERRG
ncbi:TetR/AcrR family transcriptional regulator [Streptomyces sp. JNUCC 64]